MVRAVPALTYPEIDPVAIQIGPLALRWYGLAYFAGILVGWFYARRLVENQQLWGAKGPRLTPSDIDDFILWLTVGIIVGGRLGYALFYQPGHYIDDPLGFFRIWQGGMSFHGGLAGTVIAVVLFALKRRISILSLLDVAAASVPFGLLFGRLANFINGELWGRVTDAPWGMIFCNRHIEAANNGECPAGILPRHPSQLYEAMLEGVVIFAVLRMLTHRYQSLTRPGLTGGAFIALYGMARILVEFFREPDRQLGYISGFLTMGMMLSLPMVIAGAAAVIWAARRRPG
jgi:phosphatidylglycerol:prolipoprotein diacylglycerol transferase